MKFIMTTAIMTNFAVIMFLVAFKYWMAIVGYILMFGLIWFLLVSISKTKKILLKDENKKD